MDSRLLISGVKVTYQNKRWEVAVVWEGLPFLIRAGTGDTLEEATMNALTQVVQDVTDSNRNVGDALPAVQAVQSLERS